MRRLSEILAFPRAWYRRSIARRLFLGDQTINLPGDFLTFQRHWSVSVVFFFTAVYHLWCISASVSDFTWLLIVKNLYLFKLIAGGALSFLKYFCGLSFQLWLIYWHHYLLVVTTLNTTGHGTLRQKINYHPFWKFSGNIWPFLPLQYTPRLKVLFLLCLLIHPIFVSTIS